jgi:hypothetical protein
MFIDRRTTAEALGVSVSLLAKAATNMTYGTRAEANGVLPPVHHYEGIAPRYAVADIMVVIRKRETAALAGRLRAASVKRKITNGS